MLKRVLIASFYNRGAIAPALERLATQAAITTCHQGRTLTQGPVR
jgi:hypothetical protein